MKDQIPISDTPTDPAAAVSSPPTAVASSEADARAVTPEGEGATCGCDAAAWPSGRNGGFVYLRNRPH